ncbi:hypothetical protein J2W51_001804 [Tardiphaga robiniae]|jgi:hypothetical protein|nr:hypothetical protein [Tardiphaga robiniae]
MDWWRPAVNWIDATTQERMVNVIDGWFDGVIITAE